MSRIDRLLGLVKTLETAASTVAGLTVFLIMITVCVDVAGRYLFNSPLKWSYDFIQLYLMGVAFFFALSDTLRRNHHVNVDILYNRFGRRTQLFWTAVGWSLSAVLFLVILVLIARTTWENWVAGDIIDGAVAWPTWISSAIATVGVLLIAARLVLGAIAYALALAADDPRIAAAAMDAPSANELEL